MIQNFFLKSVDNRSVLRVASNNASQFIKYLSERFERPLEVSASTVKGVMNTFDKSERDGVVFRGEILEFLWANQGRLVVFEVQ